MTTTPLPAPLRGVVPPLVTPLTPDREVDTDSLRDLVDHLLRGGVDALFVLGSSGEAALLPDRQRDTVVATVVDHAAGRVPVLAGAIDMSTARVVDHVRRAADLGADAVVVTAPFYTRTHPAEIDGHFRAVAAASPVPVFAYDIPVSVGTKLPAELVLRLAEDGVLTGVKDSSGDDAGLRGLVLGSRHLPAFSVLTGSELTVDAALSSGAHGVVPGLGNVDPDGYVRLAQAAADGKPDEARAEQERLYRLFGLVQAGRPDRMGRGSSALGAFKAALQLRGVLAHRTTALPYLPLDADEVAVVRRYLEEAGLL
ncbi:dihydrodipicolinate synthase family protein [Nakamurella endophytica]|uniref:Dihydrodipicolinate synthase family protein n=1 Tax=Nakamurella endophytica TaxID=1748367 RepID=A0A917T9X1_9ACTN|nr:dihydrodipicolinate synthase family protein [Nakamurella endophytica]GGM15011.1 dihydrodipicolinate synthase family protein [Nakamurella endophytica]